uniref:Uncharacterized protein n=1 Tax=Anguilla anguilla TaxID=7936 RepID=A0A0E9PI32_ANGAN
MCSILPVFLSILLSSDYFDEVLLLADEVKCPTGRIIDCGTGAFVMTNQPGEVCENTK